MLMRWVGTMLLATCCVAHGADLGEPAPLPAEEWDIRIQPYFWATALSGTVQPSPAVPPTDVDAKFADILKNLRFAGMVLGSVHRGRFGVSGDIQYVSVRASDNTPGDLFGRARLSAKLFIATALADYRPVNNERAEVNLSAGVRIYNVDTKLELTPGLNPGAEASASDFWADPMVGARGRFNVTEKAYVNGWAYVGGFGVGSDFASDLFAGAGYAFTDTVAANVGYRFVSMDRDTDDFEFDAVFQGPIAGLRISF